MSEGLLISPAWSGFLIETQGMDCSFLTPDQMTALHQDWRSAFHLIDQHEMQVIYRKRVDFTAWVEEQLEQSFLAESEYGRRILLDRLSAQLREMSRKEPTLLSQKILAFYSMKGKVEKDALLRMREQALAMWSAMGLKASALNEKQTEREIHISAGALGSTAEQVPEWPALEIFPGHLEIAGDIFRAVELTRLPESQTTLGMIQSITALPYPMDLCVRLIGRDSRPMLSRLDRKKRLLLARRDAQKSSAPAIENQIQQIDRLNHDLVERSEGMIDLQVTVGLRFPKSLVSFQNRALDDLIRSGSQMEYCEFQEPTLSVFDSYLECIPSFKGRNISKHTVLTSNAIHFLPVFSPPKGDRRSVVSFPTRQGSLYGLDPVDARLANYNWLVSGTSGSGKSFFVNSLIAQSLSLRPNIFIVDIGGSYNKLTRFLGGRVVSLEPGSGFQISPILPWSSDETEERMRRQHTLQIFLEMLRTEGRLPSIAHRNLLKECLDQILGLPGLPENPVTLLDSKLANMKTPEAQRLRLLLQPWKKGQFLGQYLDTHHSPQPQGQVLTYDLKSVTQFEDLARVVQLIVCASLWSRIRQGDKKRFSWIVLDEVAFTLLKTQPQFVDELVSTLRKSYGGCVIVVQDLEKITSNPAGASILQNTQTKAILQQRGDPNNYVEALSLNQVDRWAIESLRREKGAYSDIFLLRDQERVILRHRPSALEYWLSTSAPEDEVALAKWQKSFHGSFQDSIESFAAQKQGGF